MPPAGARAQRASDRDERGILSQMEGGAAARGAPRRRATGLAVGTLALAMAAVGGLLWLAAGGAAPGAGESTVRALKPTEFSTEFASTAPGAGADMEAADPGAMSDHQVSAALIQDEPLAGIGEAAVPAPAGGEKTLAEALDAVPREGSGEGELAALLAAPAAAAAAQAKPAAKPAAKPKPARADTKKTASAKPQAKAAPAKKPAAVDTDAALLAALLAHSKHPDGARHSTEFARCAALPGVTDAQRCRERLCQEGARGAPECKTVRVSKVSG